MLHNILVTYNHVQNNHVYAVCGSHYDVHVLYAHNVHSLRVPSTGIMGYHWVAFDHSFTSFTCCEYISDYCLYV